MAKKRGTVKRRRTKKVRKVRRARAGARTRRTKASPLVSQMSAYRDTLVKQQADLQTEIDKLTEAMSALGGGGTTRRVAKGRRRPTARRASRSSSPTARPAR